MKKIIVVFIAISMVLVLLAGAFTLVPKVRAATTYTVTFDSTGGSYTPAPRKGITYGATITLPKAPTKAGRTFFGWWYFDKKTGIIDNQGNKLETEFTATTPVTANITVSASYIVLGSLMVKTSAYAPNSITVVEFSSPANSPAFNFTITGKGLSVTFNLKNETRSFKGLVPGIYTLTMKEVPGYVTNSLPSDMGGISLGGNPKIASSWTTMSPEGNMIEHFTLYAGGYIARFFNNRIIHTVTFDAQGGSPTPAPRTIAYGGTISLPPAPTKAGFTFAKWNTIADGTGTTYDATTPVIADITVYASYKALPPVFVPGYWYYWNIPGFMKSTTFHFPTSILQWQNSTISFLGGSK